VTGSVVGLFLVVIYHMVLCEGVALYQVTLKDCKA